MSHSDTQGREYAKLSALKCGSMVLLDEGFSCVASGQRLVWEDENGLYFKCRHGKHYLEGQADDGDHLVGVYHA